MMSGREELAIVKTRNVGELHDAQEGQAGNGFVSKKATCKKPQLQMQAIDREGGKRSTRWVEKSFTEGEWLPGGGSWQSQTMTLLGCDVAATRCQINLDPGQ